MQLRKHARFLYQPVLPLGKNRRFFTGCKAHQELAHQAATDGTVLLKNAGPLHLRHTCAAFYGMPIFLWIILQINYDRREKTSRRYTLRQHLIGLLQISRLRCEKLPQLWCYSTMGAHGEVPAF